jgi:hypothetical protein
VAFQSESMLQARQPDLIQAPCFEEGGFVGIPDPRLASSPQVADILARELPARLTGPAPGVVVISTWPHYLPAFREVLPWLREFRQRTGTRLVYDMHASLDESWEYGLSMQGRDGRAFFQAMLEAEQDLLNAMDGVWIVSHAMMDYVNLRHRVDGPLRFFRIPCGVHSPFATPAAMHGARAEWRRRLGLADDEVVFVYSGGFGPWQMLEETFALFFGTWSRELNARLCVFSGELKAIAAHVRQQGYDPSRLVLRSLRPAEVVPALTAADVGVLLRRDNWTNRVAFPNKFSEYLAGGLLVVTTASLQDPAQILKEGSFGLAPERIDDVKVEDLRDAMARRRADLGHYYGRCLDACCHTLSYEENCRPFVEWYQGGEGTV